MFTLMCDVFIMCFVLFLFVTCFEWNFNAIAAAAAAAAAAEEGAAAAAATGGGRLLLLLEEEKEIPLGVIMTNTEIFHIFYVISLFNLPFFPYFPNLFTIRLAFLP